jgi:hypothetical protein
MGNKFWPSQALRTLLGPDNIEINQLLLTKENNGMQISIQGSVWENDLINVIL